MTDLTVIIVAAIGLLCAVAGAFLIPLVKSKLSAAELAELLKWVEIAVAAAQQLYHQLDGSKRKEYVLDFLESKGYDVDSQAVDSAIEAAVLKLHQQLVAS